MNTAYSPAAEASPATTSRPRIRVRRSSGSVASARLPSARPVAVMRCQNEPRGPRKVSANAE
jgi:hypothetical protein